MLGVAFTLFLAFLILFWVIPLKYYVYPINNDERYAKGCTIVVMLILTFALGVAFVAQLIKK